MGMGRASMDTVLSGLVIKTVGRDVEVRDRDRDRNRRRGKCTDGREGWK
jgi:hypothetical protein